MGQLRFVQPDAMIWLLAIPMIWVAVLLHRLLRERARRLSGLGPRLGALSPLTGRRRDLTFLALGTAVGAALVFAAARPQIPMRTPEYESIDLILLLDRSVSMQAEDIRPSRFTRAGLEIRNFLANRPDIIGRVGLVGFANASVTLSHATRDESVLLFYLDWIGEERAPLYGTNMAAALESALDMIHKNAAERRNIVVMVSDGEDHSGALDAAVERLAMERIPVYTVGIGSNAEVPIPARDRGVGELVLDDAGAPLTTRLNEATLRSIAAATGGGYFRSTTGEELGTALVEIANRERRIVRWRNDEYRELYPWGLWTAAATLSWLLIIL